MSVGGGYKKGKAEFAVKDVNGKDITVATESFDYVGSDKVINVNGICIDDINNNGYGIYFECPAENSEANIFIAEGALVIDGASTNASRVKIEGDLFVAGQVYGNNLYSNYVHCWQLRGGDYTFYIYTISTTDNFYADISSIFGSGGEKLVNFKGTYSGANSSHYPIQYLHYAFIASESKYNITFNCLVIENGGSVTTEYMDISVTSSSQQQGNVVKIF